MPSLKVSCAVRGARGQQGSEGQCAALPRRARRRSLRHANVSWVLAARGCRTQVLRGGEGAATPATQCLPPMRADGRPNRGEKTDQLSLRAACAAWIARTVAIVSASAARLVGAVALDPREAQRQAAGILRARLHVVEGDLDHQLGPHVHRVAVARGPRAPSSSRVCQASISSVMPLKVLPSMTKPPVAGSRAPRWRLESQPLPPPVAPLGGEHDQVERVRRLDLEPARRRGGRPRRARRAPWPSRPRGRAASASARKSRAAARRRR